MACSSEDRSAILKLKGRDWLNFSARKQEWWVNQAVAYWRSRGFPYPELTAEEMRKEFALLLKSKPSDLLTNGVAKASTVGLRLANYFHPQMWTTKVSGFRSPVECFNDDKILEDCIVKAIKFWPNRSSLNAQCLRSVLRVFNHTARVANFRPAVARAIYAKYSREGSTVLDFSAGYGGRLLGCLTLDRKYIGLDPSVDQVAGLRRMIKMLRTISIGSARIHRACAEDFLPTLDRESIDLVFSSPPYFDHERYSDEPTQSYIRYATYERWRSAFLDRVVEESWRVLKRRGYFLINAGTPRRGYPIAQDAMKSGFQYFESRRCIQLLMRRVPEKNGSSREPFKTEPILVFRKR